MGNNATDVLKIARGEVGYSRWTDPQPGTKYGRWYAKDHGSYYGTSGVPYCAMFVSWVFAQAGAKCSGLPEAYCPYILNKAKSAGKVLSNKKNAQPGDVILFDWGGDGVCDHVGIVEKNFGSYVQTIEGNTSSGSSGSQSNGGVVARRTRSWGTVKAVIRPSWGSTSSGTTSSQTSSKRVTVDGDIGPASVTEWQSQLGTTKDGVISGQNKADKKAHERINAISYDDGGSDLVKAIQKFLRARGYDVKVDGYLGAKTVTALQQWMRDELGYKNHAIDGILGFYTACNVQNALNAGAFKTSGSSTSSSKKSIDTIAKEVIAGKWGNDPQRTQKLKAAGYDAAAVQKRVNQLL